MSAEYGSQGGLYADATCVSACTGLARCLLLTENVDQRTVPNCICKPTTFVKPLDEQNGHQTRTCSTRSERTKTNNKIKHKCRSLPLPAIAVVQSALNHHFGNQTGIARKPDLEMNSHGKHL
ncbi:unnamed protein product [Polarella glacialis]|uniref:Uncharacterized protein n=1 Tax=Polarella glacialis TaxID=89957 RepID=A0A813ES70_POLGL|nr:unnamed protein product [Polarella glacialis]